MKTSKKYSPDMVNAAHKKRKMTDILVMVKNKVAPIVQVSPVESREGHKETGQTHMPCQEGPLGTIRI